MGSGGVKLATKKTRYINRQIDCFFTIQETINLSEYFTREATKLVLSFSGRFKFHLSSFYFHFTVLILS